MGMLSDLRGSLEVCSQPQNTHSNHPSTPRSAPQPTRLLYSLHCLATFHHFPSSFLLFPSQPQILIQITQSPPCSTPQPTRGPRGSLTLPCRFSSFPSSFLLFPSQPQSLTQILQATPGLRTTPHVRTARLLYTALPLLITSLPPSYRYRSTFIVVATNFKVAPVLVSRTRRDVFRYLLG